MHLPGNLTATTLGDVLGSLHRARVNGTLELMEPSGRTHRISLVHGLVAGAEVDGAVTSLGDMVRRDKLVADRELNRCVLTAMRQERLLGEVLVEEAELAPQMLEALLKRQISQRLRYLEQVKEARLTFRVANRPSKSLLRESPLGPSEFLQGRARARERDSDREPTPIPPLLVDARSVLGVSQAASPAEIQQAYRALVKRLHPDAQIDADENTRQANTIRFLRVREAYRSLVTAPPR